MCLSFTLAAQEPVRLQSRTAGIMAEAAAIFLPSLTEKQRANRLDIRLRE